MKKRSVRGLVALAAVGTMLAAGVASARDFTVVSWGGNFQDAQREKIFKPFSEKIGKPVLEQSWEGGIGILQAKVRSGNPNWDVVQIESLDLVPGCSDGLYEKIDWKAIGGTTDFLPQAVSECGVGAIIWSIGFAYDGAKLSDGPKNWADFWDVKKFPGKRGMRKGPMYTLEAALLADGVSKDDVYKELSTPAGVARAFKKLDELRPNIVWWDVAASQLQLLASGQVAMTAAYSGRIASINHKEHTNFKYVFNQSLYGMDYWVVLKGAENLEDAKKFLAYASEPQVQADFSEYAIQGMTNTKAIPLVDSKLVSELPTAQDNIDVSIPLDADFWADNMADLTRRFNAWLTR
ncbi:ABC transporter substrate-binding protein [Pseudomonas vlassakiae]|uniref:ABC transporter substrate-binding protein n=1 Tax=Pseudomonas vlassakiae TaxID=485888 RepID=A0A923GNL3_9PSED|nr:ABC transporter substrate-binding protein [Pseudomonas vlassakiae]MBV4542794.1 ABC transporter substrate-binding protein [Pseudomonas vlassakiae]